MRAALATTILGLLLVSCDDGPTAPDEDLVGLWNLPHQEEPAIYGLVSAQIIFRDDGTFLFVGTNPLSMGPLGEFTVTGTWNRTADDVTLVTGEDSQTWALDFDDTGVRFTRPASGHSFHLFRPLPD